MSSHFAPDGTIFFGPLSVESIYSVSFRLTVVLNYLTKHFSALIFGMRSVIRTKLSLEFFSAYYRNTLAPVSFLPSVTSFALLLEMESFVFRSV